MYSQIFIPTIISDFYAPVYMLALNSYPARLYKRMDYSPTFLYYYLFHKCDLGPGAGPHRSTGTSLLGPQTKTAGPTCVYELTQETRSSGPLTDAGA